MLKCGYLNNQILARKQYSAFDSFGLSTVSGHLLKNIFVFFRMIEYFDILIIQFFKFDVGRNLIK